MSTWALIVGLAGQDAERRLSVLRRVWVAAVFCALGAAGPLASAVPAADLCLKEVEQWVGAPEPWATFSQSLEQRGLTLSRAKSGDMRELWRFIRKNREQLGVSEGTDTTLSAFDQDLANIDVEYSKPGNHLLIIRDRQGKIVGSAGIARISGNTAEVRKLYLDESVRGNGMGSGVLRALLKQAEVDGYENIELETYPSMKGAIALYKKYGFEQFYPDALKNDPSGVVAFWRKVKQAPPRPDEPAAPHVVADAGAPAKAHPPGTGTGPRAPPPAAVGHSPVQREYWHFYQQSLNVEFVHELERNAKFGSSVSHPYLLEDLLKSRPAAKWYARLGIKVTAEGVKFPTHEEFVRNYIALLDELKVPKDKRMLPAVTYGRYLGHGKSEYVTLTPGVDPFPTEPGFKPVLRSPDDEFIGALAKGRMILANFHDIHHFLTFLEDPRFMANAVGAHQSYPNGKIPFLARRRLSYALESLSLAHPAKRKEIVDLLSFPRSASARKAGSGSGVTPYVDHFFRMERPDLIAQADRLIRGYDDLLGAYSGASMSTTERALEIKAFEKEFGHPPSAILKAFATGKPFDNKVQLPRESFLEDPFLFTTKLRMLKNYGEELSKAPPTVERKQELARLDQVLRLHMARMEYFLFHSSGRIDHRKWLADMGRSDFSTAKNETLDFIRNAFGSDSVTYRMLSQEK